MRGNEDGCAFLFLKWEEYRRIAVKEFAHQEIST